MDPREDQRVTAWYNSISASYDELYGLEQSIKHKAIISLLGEQKFDVLIDMGCGHGSFLKRFEEGYNHAVGIDLSIEMLKTAKRERSARTDLVLGSARLVPIKDRAVDCIVSVSAIPQDEALGSVLSEMKRIGHKDAVLALTLLHSPGDQICRALPSCEGSSRISGRETVCIIHLNDCPKIDSLDSLG